ncbi:MAG TPA: phospho-N-acetylmuramoyl-pentapeptide-transferase [Candidatus Krumholzibacteria bacterium]|nr:phospho-N-acetylmuramoyl-pentapeptide-transferase [Candidatus Krumholzibacteria bacterium]HRX50045.1 phospho-N-acetylmuramoyl-pentapeptide-transferase [Candidatus Krumholzibacteria bacterium]
MFYHLLYPLHTHWSALNVFQYITFRSAYAAVTALLISFVFGDWVIRKLGSLQWGETIREEGPQHHAKKAGTPTMGGVLILTAIVIPTLLWGDLSNRAVQLALLGTVWMGAIGFVDDWLKVVKKRPKGMIGRVKLVGQVGFSLILYAVIHFFWAEDFPQTRLVVPFLKDTFLDVGWLYLPLVVCVVTGTSNAVNLTDGLDGLAIGLSAFSFLGFAALAYLAGNVIFADYLNILYLPGAGELTVYCAAVVGAALGFLWFNAHPARVFMGDTGSLALGGALGTVAILTKRELLLVVIGGMFVLEALSVMLQVASFRWRGGKRIFRMAPLHHHFELLGWSETQVVVRFWIVGILLLLLSMSTIKLQ